MIWNTAFDPAAVGYEPSTRTRSTSRRSSRSTRRSSPQRLVERYDIRGKTVVEIGCGKGDFLALALRARRQPRRRLRPDATRARSTRRRAADPLRAASSTRRETALETPTCVALPARARARRGAARRSCTASARDRRRRARRLLLRAARRRLPAGEQARLGRDLRALLRSSPAPALRRVSSSARGLRRARRAAALRRPVPLDRGAAGAPASSPLPPRAAVARLAPLAETLRRRRPRAARALGARAAGAARPRPGRALGRRLEGRHVPEPRPREAGVDAVVDSTRASRAASSPAPASGSSRRTSPAVRAPRLVLVMNPLYRDEIERTLEQLGAAAKVVVV